MFNKDKFIIKLNKELAELENSFPSESKNDMFLLEIDVKKAFIQEFKKMNLSNEILTALICINDILDDMFLSLVPIGDYKTEDIKKLTVKYLSLL